MTLEKRYEHGNTAGVPYGRSGLKALEEALSSFLAEEKAAAFLAAVTRKALRILADGLCDGGAAAGTLAETRAKMGAIYQRIIEGRMVDEAAEPSPAAQVGAASVDWVAPQKPVETNIAADLRTRGCPVCRHLAKQSWDFLTHWQYRSSHSPPYHIWWIFLCNWDAMRHN